MWAPSHSLPPPPNRSPAVRSALTAAAEQEPGRVRSALTVAAAAAILAGCAVGPNYTLPATQVDAHFANAGEPGLEGGDAVEQYWTGFADPLLNSLIDDSLAHNKALDAAAANLRAARAAKRLAGFDQYPTVTLGGGYTHN